MTKIFRPLKPEEISEINQAIEKAELNTSAEICPLIVKKVESDELDRNTIVTRCAWIGFIALVFLSPTVKDFSYYLCLTVKWICFFFAIKLHSIRKTKLISIVNKEADFEFEHQGIGETLFSNGVLLFISLEDKRVVVLADEQIKDQTNDETWVKVIENFQLNVKEKSLKDAIIQAVEEIGEICAPLCPKSHEDANEIKNEIIIKG